MVRVTECFECGANEKDVKLIFTTEGPTLCEKCSKKCKNNHFLRLLNNREIQKCTSKKFDINQNF